MGKKLILKTALVCTGIFSMLITLVAYYVLNTYKFDTEKRIAVVVATNDIRSGDILNESMVVFKTIKESALNNYMITDLKNVIGMKSIKNIASGDYITSYELLQKKAWYNDEQKIIVLPMTVDERLGNLIKKGSFVDIKLVETISKGVPKVVLSKILIEDILDENGISTGQNAGNKKTFAKFVLDNKQRDRIYAAKTLGTLMYELYCDDLQKPSIEEFQIPKAYLGLDNNQ